MSSTTTGPRGAGAVHAPAPAAAGALPDAAVLRNHLTARLPHYLDCFEQLVRINSFSTNAAGVARSAEKVASIFAPLGFVSELVDSSDERCGPHLFLNRSAASEQQGSAPLGTLVMVSHLDTVFSEDEERRNGFGWRVEGERIYGPGTIDIKGGTIVAYMVLDTLHACAPELFARAGWQLCFDAGEELFLADFPEHCLRRIAPDARACLVFEAGRLDDGCFKIVTNRKGRASFLIEAEGRSAHAGSKHERGANAIRQLAEAIEQLERITDYDRRLTVNVGIVSGGETTNRVPSYAAAEVEMRAFDPEVFGEGVRRVEALGSLSSVAAHSDGYRTSTRVTMSFLEEPWPVNPGTEGLYELWSSAAGDLGYRTEPQARGGLSDGNRLWRRLPTLDGLGPSGDNDHCAQRSADGSRDQEYVDSGSLVPKALLNTVAILKLLQQPAR